VFRLFSSTLFLY